MELRAGPWSSDTAFLRLSRPQGCQRGKSSAWWDGPRRALAGARPQAGQEAWGPLWRLGVSSLLLSPRCLDTQQLPQLPLPVPRTHPLSPWGSAGGLLPQALPDPPVAMTPSLLPAL